MINTDMNPFTPWCIISSLCMLLYLFKIYIEYKKGDDEK